MIFFFSEGRLGNQLFQFAFLQTIRVEKEIVITVGFDDICDVFRNIDVKNFKKINKYFVYLYYSIFRPLFEKIARFKLITEISVDHEKIQGKYEREKSSYTIKKGFFSNVRFIKTGYFQTENIFNALSIKDLQIRNFYINKASLIIANIPTDFYTVFVHIRLTDYSSQLIFGKSVLLPLSYYQQQIDWFKEKIKNVFFIFLSDDPGKTEEIFGGENNSLFSRNNHPGVDLGIMTMCRGGIMSPSSFSWWGAYLMKNREVVFAPKYWLGFNSKIENPCDACPSFAHQIEI